MKIKNLKVKKLIYCNFCGINHNVSLVELINEQNIVYDAFLCRDCVVSIIDNLLEVEIESVKHS